MKVYKITAKNIRTGLRLQRPCTAQEPVTDPVWAAQAAAQWAQAQTQRSRDCWISVVEESYSVQYQ
jgi:hypothetical protein